MKILPAVLAAALLFLVAAPAHATEYFFGSWGSDANPCNSPAAVCRTLARANQLKLSPGDRINLATGETFAGSLVLTASGRGGAPIIVTTWDDSGPRATIAAGDGPGIIGTNVEHITIERVNVAGAGYYGRGYGYGYPAYGYGYGGPAYGYAPAAYGYNRGCWRRTVVYTPYGPRSRRLWVC